MFHKNKRRYTPIKDAYRLNHCVYFLYKKAFHFSLLIICSKTQHNFWYLSANNIQQTQCSLQTSLFRYNNFCRHLKDTCCSRNYFMLCFRYDTLMFFGIFDRYGKLLISFIKFLCIFSRFSCAIIHLFFPSIFTIASILRYHKYTIIIMM